MPDYLAQVHELLECRPELDAIYSNHTVFSSQRVVEPDLFAVARPGFWHDFEDAGFAYLGDGPLTAAKFVASRSLLWMTGGAVRRRFLDVIGTFDESMAGFCCEDFEFTLRAIANGSVGFLKECLVRIRQHDGNFSSVGPLKATKDQADLLQFCLDHHPHAQAGPLRQALSSRVERHRRDYLYEAFRRGEWQAVRQGGVDLRGTPLSAKERIKLAVAHLPASVSNALHAAAIWRQRAT
jgi:hypothetical protein